MFRVRYGVADRWTQGATRVPRRIERRLLLRCVEMIEDINEIGASYTASEGGTALAGRRKPLEVQCLVPEERNVKAWDVSPRLR